MLNSKDIVVGGFVPFTTIDYPGLLSAVIFMQGCPLKCKYCSNPTLQDPKAESSFNWGEIIKKLEQRKGFLEGVILSGGEPLLQENIGQAIKEIKDLGYKIGIHTSGFYINKLDSLSNLIDWVGLDIKAPIEKYETITGNHKAGKLAYQALDFLSQKNIDFEVRTTLDPRFLTENDIISLAYYLKNKNIKTFALQEYRPITEDKNKEPGLLERKKFFKPEFIAKIKPLFKNLILREA